MNINYHFSESDLALFETVFQKLVEQELTLSTCESCTGGWLAKTLTDFSGSSSCFIGSVVAYSNQVKQEWLGVPLNLLTEYGAVSEPVAKIMAEQGCSRFKTDCCISTTGIAGPGGGSPEKPVGMVVTGFAFSNPAKKTVVHTLYIENQGRDWIRSQTVLHVFSYLLDWLNHLN